MQIVVYSLIPLTDSIYNPRSRLMSPCVRAFLNFTLQQNDLWMLDDALGLSPAISIYCVFLGAYDLKVKSNEVIGMCR